MRLNSPRHDRSLSPEVRFSEFHPENARTPDAFIARLLSHQRGDGVPGHPYILGGGGSQDAMLALRTFVFTPQQLVIIKDTARAAGEALQCNRTLQDAKSYAKQYLDVADKAAGLLGDTKNL